MDLVLLRVIVSSQAICFIKSGRRCIERQWDISGNASTLACFVMYLRRWVFFAMGEVWVQCPVALYPLRL